MSDLLSTMRISGSGMRVQTERINVIAQNVANADTGPSKPGDLPYTRKTITFKSYIDKDSGEKMVRVDKISPDTKSDYIRRYQPGHPAADENGYVLMPNVQSLVESMDMKEASKSYEANMGIYTQTRDMVSKTVDLLR
jgi:flagellar basal-body rod protein FlgC